MKQDLKNQTIFSFALLCPIFLVFSLLLSRWYDGHQQDFANYWQAGHMILAGQNVYDSEEWVSVRLIERTAYHSEPTFQYPLPVAVLFSLLAWLPVQSAYILWMFLDQVAILISITILLNFSPARSGYLGLLAIAGIFLFRPVFFVLYSGQLVVFLLLLLTISIRLFRIHKWFWGGFALSFLALKPSIGFPIFLFSGLWLLFRKKWQGIWGMIAGGFVLLLIGMAVNYRWPIDYINIGEYSLSKYYGMHPTLWGVVGKLFKTDIAGIAVGLVCVAFVFAVATYLFWKNKSEIEAFSAFAIILPAGLLVSPYSWHYDQILLVVSIVFLLINISAKYGLGRAALFMFGILALAFATIAAAYPLGHDVLSFLNSLVIWIFSLYFVAKNN